jgi:hypothetical protein
VKLHYNCVYDQSVLSYRAWFDCIVGTRLFHWPVPTVYADEPPSLEHWLLLRMIAKEKFRAALRRG